MKRCGHFGAGEQVLDGFENYDKYPVDNRVKILDMNHMPYHFCDDWFDELVCRHTLEHLDVNSYDVLHEMHRITKDDGLVTVELPIFGNLVSHNHFFHSRNYMNPVLCRRHDNEYIRNLFELESFQKKQRCGLKKILWKMKTRFLTWVDSFLFDSYEWQLRVKK